MCHPAVQDTDTLHREQVVSSIRVIVNAAEKSCCCILANVLHQKMTPTWVLIKEIRNIVDETGDDDKRALLCLFTEALPADDKEVVRV